MTAIPDTDRQQLQQLAIEYANAIDARDWDRLDRVFTPDAWIDYTAMGGIAGNYAEVKAWLPRSLRFFKSYMHLVGNFQYQIGGAADGGGDGHDGDNGRARGQVACFNPMVLPGLLPGLPRTVALGLWYEDEYLRTAEGWRISRRSERKCYALNEPLWMKLGVWFYRRWGRRTQRMKDAAAG